MVTLSDEQLRALHFLARHPRGCTEATLLEQGFTAGQLGYLVYAGLVKLRGSPQFPNKTRSTLTRDRFCGPEHPGTSHLRVVYHLVGFCGTHGESGHDRVQSARVGLA
jgi:hypothetical protein